LRNSFYVRAHRTSLSYYFAFLKAHFQHLFYPFFLSLFFYTLTWYSACLIACSSCTNEIYYLPHLVILPSSLLGSLIQLINKYHVNKIYTTFVAVVVIIVIVILCIKEWCWKKLFSFSFVDLIYNILLWFGAVFKKDFKNEKTHAPQTYKLFSLLSIYHERKKSNTKFNKLLNFLYSSISI
jgi:prepilin signal peptidase PulO-like enzyme (type II secretory pathway)